MSIGAILLIIGMASLFVFWFGGIFILIAKYGKGGFFQYFSFRSPRGGLRIDRFFRMIRDNWDEIKISQFYSTVTILCVSSGILFVVFIIAAIIYSFVKQ